MIINTVLGRACRHYSYSCQHMIISRPVEEHGVLSGQLHVVVESCARHVDFEPRIHLLRARESEISTFACVCI